MINEIGKNKIMRTPEYKEQIVKRYLNGESVTKLANEIESTGKVIREWTRKYEESGIEGLKSKTGKQKKPKAGLHLRKPQNRIEELEL